MKTRATENGIFFFREKRDGTKKRFIELINEMQLEYNDAGNMMVVDFIKKYSKKSNLTKTK